MLRCSPARAGTARFPAFPHLRALLGPALLVLLSAHPSSATVLADEAFDVTLLRADAIFFASVDGLADAADDPEAADVTFVKHRSLRTRWDAKGNAPRSIRVAGRRAADGTVSVRKTPHVFAAGHRYLLFLQGGPWVSGPFLRGPLPVLEVVGDRVECPGGGSVYGVSVGGLVCSTPDQQAGPPLTEAEVGDLLTSALKRAAKRRPSLAQRLEAESQALRLLRNAAP